jgi:hypothetical protein
MNNKTVMTPRQLHEEDEITTMDNHQRPSSPRTAADEKDEWTMVGDDVIAADTNDNRQQADVKISSSIAASRVVANANNDGGDDEIPDIEEESVTSSVVQTETNVATMTNVVSSLSITESPSTDEVAAAIKAAVDAAADGKAPANLTPEQAKVVAAAAASPMTLPDGTVLPEGTIPVIVEVGSIKESKLQASLRKAGVAVAGGVILGVGLVMIPLPTPCGIVVAASGMGVLATEFPEAQKVLDKSREHALKARDRLVETIEKSTAEHVAEEELEIKLKEANKDKTLSSTEAIQESNSDDPQTAANSNSTEPPSYMNARERERQMKAQAASQQQQPPQIFSRYQTRRTVTRSSATHTHSSSRSNATGSASGQSIEESFDAARRKFRRTATQLGQSVLPFLKRLDTPSESTATDAEAETAEAIIPSLNEQATKSAPNSAPASPKMEPKESPKIPPVTPKREVKESLPPSSPQDILPYMNKRRTSKSPIKTKIMPVSPKRTEASEQASPNKKEAAAPSVSV